MYTILIPELFSQSSNLRGFFIEIPKFKRSPGGLILHNIIYTHPPHRVVWQQRADIHRVYQDLPRNIPKTLRPSLWLSLNKTVARDFGEDKSIKSDCLALLVGKVVGAPHRVLLLLNGRLDQKCAEVITRWSFSIWQWRHYTSNHS